LAVKPDTQLSAEGVAFVTTWAVILEVLAYFSRAGPNMRRHAVELVERLRASDGVEIITLADDLLADALRLYALRLDKRYSLADCVSMVVCRGWSISDVLTADRDFQAEGFTILMPN